MENTKWLKLNKKGYILNHIRNDSMLGIGSGIYAYRLIFDNTRFYIGSTINLAQCFRQHRYRCSKYIGNNNKFYNAIKNFGWNSFEHGILENFIMENKAIVDIEQNYLDNYSPSPSLNTSKKAGSMLGYKHSDIDKLKMGDLLAPLINKSYKWAFKPGNTRIVCEKTRSKLKLRTGGTLVCIYDKNWNLIKSLPTLKKAGNFVGLSYTSVSKYMSKGTLWNDKYYFKDG